MEEDITNHLHMCVALMSDPLTMRDRPGVVADHFVAAMGKIERLQVLLAVPAEPCARQNWLGGSILNSGVRQMVGLVLTKHMEPLRWKHPRHILKHNLDGLVEGQRNAAPRIFALDFKQEGYKPCHETDMAREIKETNCMAALVLLYYYLNWHLLLILLNYRLHPCVGGHEVESRLDVDKLLKGLPAFFDTLELRPLRSRLNRDYSKTSEGDDLSDCSSDGDNSEVDEEDVAVQPVAENGVDGGANARQVDGIGRIQTAINEMMQSATRSGVLDGCMLSLADSLISQPRAENGGDGARRRPVNNLKKRRSKLVNVYRTVLASVSAVDKADALLQNAHVLGFYRVEADVYSGYATLMGTGKYKQACVQHLERRIVHHRDESIIDGLDLCSHSLSVFELQDSVQRWFDMCKPFEVKSLSPEQDEDDIDSTQKRYTCTLSEVLRRPPFNLLSDREAKEKLQKICIHDFNSAALMMDVCGSFMKMHSVVSDLRKGLLEDSVIKKGLMLFIRQTYASDRAVHKFLKQNIQSLVPSFESNHRMTGLVATTVGNFRKPARIANADEVNDELNLFELAGHYWGSKPADVYSVNHTYFAWPYVEHGNYQKALKLIQYMLHVPQVAHSIIFELLLSPGHRNSLFVSSVVKSMLAMIDSLHCTALLDGSAITVKEVDTIHRTKKSVTEGFLEPGRQAMEDNAQYLMGFNRINSPYTFDISKQTLIDDLRAELSALSSRVERAKRGEFKLYTGFSWPVVYGEVGAGNQNHAAFQLEGEMPMVPRTRTEYYLSQIARTASYANREFDNPDHGNRPLRNVLGGHV